MRLFNPIRSVRTLLTDIRYGAYLRGGEKTRFAHLGAHNVGNASYLELSYVFPEGTIGDGDVLVDLGCGKGRVLNWWLKERGNRNRLIGIELDPDWAERVRRRLARYRSVEIITGNVLDVLPTVDANVIFMFNPFNETVMRGVEELLRGKNVRIFYYYSKHVSVWRNGHWDVEVKPPPRKYFYDLAVIRPLASLSSSN